MKRVSMLALLGILLAACPTHAMEGDSEDKVLGFSPLLPKVRTSEPTGLSSVLLPWAQQLEVSGKQSESDENIADVQHHKSVLLCYLGRDSVFGSRISTWLDIP